MSRRLLVTGAGTGATNNLVRSLRAGDPSLVLIGCHTNRFVLTQSTADRRANGLFSVDLKENAAGEPCVTEINAGRFLAGTNILDQHRASVKVPKKRT